VNNIAKPITVAREEFKQDIFTLCEKSGLPLFVVEDVLKYFLEQVHIASVEQYKIDKEEYEQALKQQETKTE
jgi:hypothetical protein